MEATDSYPTEPATVNPDKVDALLAHELTAMSFKEREAVYEEVHGVVEIVDESEGFLKERLEAMEEALRNIPNKRAFEMAQQTSNKYVTGISFRLLFLRANGFRAEKAATNMVQFLEEKLHYFGPEVLPRPIYLTDLDKNDKEVLKSGRMQLLPHRDRNGRAIFGDFNMINSRCYKRPENVVRTTLLLLICITTHDLFFSYHFSSERLKHSCIL